jgi:hypothetical protein
MVRSFVSRVWGWHRVALAALVALVAGCGASDSGTDRFDAGETPGNSPWSSEIGCSADADCLTGELCEAGVCQMARCLDAYTSQAPLGAFRYLGVDGEIIFIGDNHYVDGFEVADDGYIGSIDLTAEGAIVDLVGGNLNGQRPQGVATVISDSAEVLLEQSDGLSTLDVGFVPSDVGAGDVDGDGLDELVALGRDGDIAICDVDTNSCTHAAVEGVKGRDVALGDVDGDGYDEVLLLLEDGSDEMLLIYNVDAALTGQEASYGWGLSFDAKEIDAGDIYGRGSDVVVVKHEGGWAGNADDKLEVFDVSAEAFIASKSISSKTVDVTVGDRDGDERDEIVTLRDDHKFELFGGNDDLSLDYLGTASISVGSSAQRVAFVDYDGDSPAGRLVEGPELVAGQAVPMAVMLFPPYPHDVAGGPLGASVELGQTETTDETLSDTVSLSVGMTASFGAEAFGFKAKVSAFLKQSASQTTSTTTAMSVGARYSAHADPDFFGRNYATVVMSCGCYHRYRYETDDPAGKLDGSGALAELMVPVGGQTQLWSSPRYNALAKATGTIPVIEVPTSIGDPGSYPATPTTLAGAAIAPDDMVFPNPPTFSSSDVGFVGFELSASESETNAVAQTTTVGMSAGIGAFGAGLDVDTSIGVTQGYSIRVGNRARFAGRVPPIPDDPNTPEDEFMLHRYTFTPLVYREHWTNAEGEDSGYYVLSYAVAQPQ